MTKVIIIEKCRYCPNIARRNSGIFGRNPYSICLISTKTYTFDPKSEPREIVDLDVIPDWCKLKEAIPNLKELQYDYEKKEMIKKYHLDTSTEVI
jgi:hypothetical protein